MLRRNKMMNNLVRQFDLNIERVLEHWTVAHALREIIANALDEQALTGTVDPAIFKDAQGAWHIKDSGRGLRYEHLTQNENQEKLKEENFLFSYNITSLTTALRKALNRERTHVGRSAYTDRVKAILLECPQAQVAEALAQDLKNFETGKIHDELQWTDVSLHACRILNAREKSVFLTAEQLRQGSSLITHAQRDGYRVIVVPTSIALKLPQIKDIQGQPIRDLGEYRQEWDRSFQFHFVSPDQLLPAEQRVFALTQAILHLLTDPSLYMRVREIRISQTMRMDYRGEEVLGIWEPAERRIVIRRDQLRDIEHYAATLLHEATHAITGADDGSFEFEQGLTGNLGKVAAQALEIASKV
jgi:hypothetical protein